MPLARFQFGRIGQSLKTQASLGVDLLMLLVIGGLVGAIFSFGKELAAPSQHKIEINLSLWALPKYTFFSLARGFAGYILSLVFTLIYGSVAAHNRRAEKIMIPALDVLQSLPVLTFMPGLVIAMVRLLPTRQLGLEIACIIMIFTGQAWNMTFSYYSSVRAVPQNLREVAALHHLSRWRVFRLIELPASMIGLVWNSMMSMAGGWFILNVTEANQIGTLDYRLPGIGSYMSEANDHGTLLNQIAGVVAMMVMIVAVDQLIWRPIVVWSDRFKTEETAESDKASSWVLSLVKHSLLYPWIVRQIHSARQRSAERSAAINSSAAAIPAACAPVSNETPPTDWRRLLNKGLMALVMVLLAFSTFWGTWKLVRLLTALPWHDPSTHSDWQDVLLALFASLGRVAAALFLGAIWALPAGILIGLSPKWSQRLQPIVQVLASFPANMIYLPITLILLSWHIPFNIGCVVLMVLGTQWYVLYNVIAGAMAIPTELKEVGRVYQTPRLLRWTRIYIPGVFPHLVTGLITAAGGAWNATIVAEYVQSHDKSFTAFGLGSMITLSTNNGDFSLEAAAAVTLAVAVVILNRYLWRRLYALAEKRYNLET